METETDLQAAYRIQKWLKEIKEETELTKIELEWRIDHIQRSGVLSDGTLELTNKPKLYWEIDVEAVKKGYPLLIPGIVDKINAEAKEKIEELDKHLPVGLVQEAMKQYGIVDKYGHGVLTGLGTQIPQDNWVILPSSPRRGEKFKEE